MLKSVPRQKIEIAAQHLRKLAESVGPGGRLPTFRHTMTELGVSQATIEAALRRLESEGIVRRKPGSGVYAAKGTGRRPILILCDGASFVGPSPFWEILLEKLLDPHRNHPDRLVIEFTVPYQNHLENIEVTQIVSESLWPRIRAGGFSAVIAVCVEERLTWAIEALGVPVIAFGCPSHTMVRMAFLESCSLGVGELVRLGCRRIALYNAPHIAAREVFVAALSVHGASECVVPNSTAFAESRPQVGNRFKLIEHGFHEAVRLFGPQSVPEERPDGLVSIDDTFTQGFIMGLIRQGMAPGKHIQIASHVNIGSPTLVGWHPVIVGLQFDIAQIAVALNAAADQMSRGETPNRGGWEHSLLMNEREGPLRTLTLRPRVRRPS